MHKIGYSEQEAEKIKQQVQFYSDVRDTIKQASGDYVDLKRFEPGMRQLMDMYLDAKSSKKISDFENKSLVDLILHVSEPPEPYGNKRSKEAVAETIENNVRKVIIEETQTNPKYYEKMSKLLDELIKQRKEETIAYQEYLEKIKQLAGDVTNPMGKADYPISLNSIAKRNLFDNLNNDEILALAIDNVIKSNKLDGWRDGGLKEKKLRIAINEIIKDDSKTEELMQIVKAQNEY